MIEKGTEIIFRGEKRRVTGHLKNTEGNIVILWESSNSEGGCMPSVWLDWEKSGKEKSRNKKNAS